MPINLSSYMTGGDLSDPSQYANRVLNRAALLTAMQDARDGDGIILGADDTFYHYEMVPGTANDRITLDGTFGGGREYHFIGNNRETCGLRHYPRTLSATPVYCFYSVAAVGMSLAMTDFGVDWPDQKSVAYWNAGQTGAGGATVVGENAFWYHLAGSSPVAVYPNHGTNDITLTRVKLRGKIGSFIYQSKGHCQAVFEDVDLEYGNICYGGFDGFGEATPQYAYNRSLAFVGTHRSVGGFTGADVQDGGVAGAGWYVAPHTAVNTSGVTGGSATRPGMGYLFNYRVNIKQFSGSEAQGVAPDETVIRNLHFAGGGFDYESSGETGDLTDIANCYSESPGHFSMRNDFIVANSTCRISRAAVIRRQTNIVGVVNNCTFEVTRAGAAGYGFAIDARWTVTINEPTVVFSGAADSTSSFLQHDGNGTDSAIRVVGGQISGPANVGLAVSGAASGTTATLEGTTVNGLWACMRVDGASAESLPGTRIEFVDCDLSAATRICHFNGTQAVVGYGEGNTIGSGVISFGAGAVAQEWTNRQTEFATPLVAATSLTLNRDYGRFDVTGTGTINTLTWTGLTSLFGAAVVTLVSRDGFSLGSSGNINGNGSPVPAGWEITLRYSRTLQKWVLDSPVALVVPSPDPVVFNWNI